MKTEVEFKEVMGLVETLCEASVLLGRSNKLEHYGSVSKYKLLIKSKLRELLTPVELSDEDIKNIDDNTHFYESPDWSVRFARNVLKAAGVY